MIKVNTACDFPDQSTDRARDRGVIGRRLGQLQIQESPQRKRIGAPILCRSECGLRNTRQTQQSKITTRQSFLAAP